MAKLKVSATLVSQTLFRGMDKCPVICGASWDGEHDCVLLDIVGNGVPETDGVVIAQITKRTPMTITFVEEDSR